MKHKSPERIMMIKEVAKLNPEEERALAEERLVGDAWLSSELLEEKMRTGTDFFQDFFQ